MSAIKVSVILPSFNVYRYIQRCLSSVQCQTLYPIEIICVDAASTDGTQEYIAAQTGRDERIKFIVSSERSVGKQMNMGIQAACGEYIGIVETDDYIVPAMYQELYEAAIEHDADIVLRDYQAFWGNGADCQVLRKSIAQTGQYHRAIRPGDEQAVFYNDMSIWSGIYRREFLLKNDIWENETSGASYQDTGFWFQAFAYARCLYYLPGADYGYCYRLDNTSSSVHSEKKVYAVCDEFMFIQEQLKKRGLFEHYHDTYFSIMFNRYLWNYLRIAEEYRQEFAYRFKLDMSDFSESMPISIHQRGLLSELLQSPVEFHSKRQREREALLNLLSGLKSIVIFGCGSDGIRMLNYLLRLDRLRYVTCLSDNNVSLHGTWLFHKRIIAPSKIRDIYPDACYIISSLNYGDVIREQLLISGVKASNIWTGHVC